MKRALFSSMALTAALLVAMPASPASALSGCQIVDIGPEFGGTVGFSGYEFFAGEQITGTPSTPTGSATPTTITLTVDGTVVDTTAFPGTVSYIFPADDTSVRVEFRVSPGSSVTWDLSCQLARPTTPEQCKNGGWEAFGFKNQGDCVSFVATEGKNEPGQNVPNT